MADANTKRQERTSKSNNTQFWTLECQQHKKTVILLADRQTKYPTYLKFNRRGTCIAVSVWPPSSGQQFYGACDRFKRRFVLNSYFHRNVGFNSHNTESKSMRLSQMFILRQSDEIPPCQTIRTNLCRLWQWSEVTDITVKFASVDTHCVPFSSLFTRLDTCSSTTWRRDPFH